MDSTLGFLHQAYLQTGLFLNEAPTPDPIICGQGGGAVKWYKMWLHRALLSTGAGQAVTRQGLGVWQAP